MRSATHSHRRFVGLLRLVVVWTGLIGLLGSGPDAWAQVRDVEPHHVVVTNERVYLRCGAGGVWYAIGYANTGDVLRVDGQDFKWVRVAYPEGVHALVSIEEADLSLDRGVVTITRPSRLKARNIHGQRFGDSWKNLLTETVSPGTELKYIDSLRDVNGQVEGYIVEAPRGARAFISEEFTRRATPSEVEAFRAAQRAARQAAAQPAQDEAAPQVAQAPETQTHEETTSDAPALDAPVIAQARTTEPEHEPAAVDAVDVDETQPVMAPATTIADAAPTPREMEAAPVTSVEGSKAEEALTIAATNEAVPATTREMEAAVERTPPTIDELESAFKALATQSIEEAEIAPLIAEYERFRNSIDDTEDNRAWRMRVENRIALLKVRLEVQENLRELHAATERADAGAKAIAERVSQLDSTRPYALVGRLAASAIYDGKRLPLMYRLQSVDSGGGRTIAYLAPSPEIDLRGKLGAIVGVEGRSRVDQGLKLHIVQPTRVDLLTPRVTNVIDDDQPD